MSFKPKMFEYDSSRHFIKSGVAIDPNVIQFPTGQRGKTSVTSDITNDLNPLLFEQITVAEFEGKYYVTEGGNRVRAACNLNLVNVDCRVLFGLTMDEINKLCAFLNLGRKVFTASQTKNAMLQGNEEVYTYINNVLDLLSLDGAPTSSMLKLYEWGVLENTMEILSESRIWERNRVARSVRFIEGAGMFIRDFSDKLDDVFLTQIMSQLDPNSAMVVLGGNSSATPTTVKEYLRGYYNQKMGPRKKSKHL